MELGGIAKVQVNESLRELLDEMGAVK